MQASLKKSLYLGLAALGFVAVAGATNATTANAAAAKEVSKTTIEHMNVNVTGKNAMYTRPGTLKGAKMVASTTTLNRMKDSKKGQDNWMAYQTVTTDRGSIYYKVVSFDKAYRGYIYAGSTKENPKGGLVKFDTFKQDAAVSKENAETSWNFKTPGTTNDGSSLTYKDAMWTVMGSGRVIKDSTPYAKDALTITKQGTRTREGDQWVYVEDEANPSVNGWILKSGLKASNDVPASKGVTVKYVDQKDGKTVVGTKVIKFAADGKNAEGKDTMNVYAKGEEVIAGTPTGYTNTFWADEDSAKAATEGSTQIIYVKQNATVDTLGHEAYAVSKGSANVKLSPVDATGKDIDLKAVKLSGVTGTDIKASDVTAAVKAAKADTIYSKNDDGTYSKYTFNIDDTMSTVVNGADYLKYGKSNLDLGYEKQAGSYTLNTSGSMVEA